MIPTGKWVRKHPDFLKVGCSNGSRSTGSKQRGIEYHNRVYRAMRSRFGALAPATAAQPQVARQLLIEPWYKRLGERAVFRQPDAVLLFPQFKTAIVVEVKLNWKDGRDVKLIDEYLGIVKSAEGLQTVWPLLITQCLRGWQGRPIFSWEEVERCQAWQQGDPTPLMLFV